MVTFSQFLHDRGLIRAELSPAELDALRKEHRKLYKRLWQREADKQVLRKQISFSKDDFRMIETAAKRHQLSFSAFVVKAVFAYLNRCYIVLDKQQEQELKLGLKRLGVNLNQVAFQANRTQSVSLPQVVELQLVMQRLEKLLHEQLTRPQDLNALVQQALQEHPNYKAVLLDIIRNTDPDAD